MNRRRKAIHVPADVEAAYRRAGEREELAHERLVAAVMRGGDELEMRPIQRMLDAALDELHRLRPLVEVAAKKPATAKAGIALKFPGRRAG